MPALGLREAWSSRDAAAAELALRARGLEGREDHHRHHVGYEGRLYNHQYVLRKLRFMVANPIRTNDGLTGFVALGLTPPIVGRQAA